MLSGDYDRITVVSPSAYGKLIADDEPIERTIIERMVKNNFPENVEIVKAINGREAVKLYTEKQCQIALLDIEADWLMPKESNGILSCMVERAEVEAILDNIGFAHKSMSDYFYDYDYIVGDIAYSKLRLKGFYDEKTNTALNNIVSYRL